jgi:hypothetical protein
MKYLHFLYNLFNYYKLKPSYIFITISERGYDLMCFSKYYLKLIKKIYFIDTLLLGKYQLMYKKFKGNLHLFTFQTLIY